MLTGKAKTGGSMAESKISREQAVQIARQVCDERGWPWKEPVVYQRGIWPVNWVIFMHLLPGKKPNPKIEIVINARTGKVTKAKRSFLPR